MTPFRWDFTIPTIHAVWGGATGQGDILDLRLGDGSVQGARMHIRPTPGQTGAPLIALALAAPDADGISAAYDSTLADPDTALVVGGTRLRLQIGAGQLAGLPWGQVLPDEPLQLWYDILLATAAEPQQLYAQGSITVCQGVTIP